LSAVLILGGSGYTGRLIARHLLGCSDARVTLAARRPGKAHAYAQLLNEQYAGYRASALQADAADPDSLRAAFRDHDLVVVAAPITAHTTTVARAALECGVDYLDVQMSAEKLDRLQALRGEIDRAGRCFITEAGYHPGLPAALVRYAAAHLDRLDRAVTAGYLNMGSSLPYSEAVDELIELFKHFQAQVYLDGRWTNGGSYVQQKIDFGGDIGRKQCYSMFFEELRPLPEMFPELRELGFYISASHWMTDWVVLPLIWLWLRLNPGAVRPAGRLLWWSMGTFHRPPYRVELQVHADGERNGQPAQVQASVSHVDGYELTAIPVVAALLQYLDGSARKPGLWMMGHLVDPARLMVDMQSMGAQVKIDPGHAN
jgi:saccharopine dehydrogenase-like NADP-dependent oxidoreductase